MLSSSLIDTEDREDETLGGGVAERAGVREGEGLLLPPRAKAQCVRVWACG